MVFGIPDHPNPGGLRNPNPRNSFCPKPPEQDFCRRDSGRRCSGTDYRLEPSAALVKVWARAFVCVSLHRSDNFCLSYCHGIYKEMVLQNNELLIAFEYAQ